MPWIKWAFSFFLLMLSLSPAVISALQQNGITSPVPGDSISGVVTISGTAAHPEYLRYELAFLYEGNQAAGWIVFAEGSEPVQDAPLAIWDTTVGRNVGAPVFPDGSYQLRLRVVKQDYNYDEFFISGVTVQNEGPTATPTPDETAVRLTGTAAVIPDNNIDSAGTAVFNLPTPLPSLTPFPTPTLPPTPVPIVETGQEPFPNEAEGGLLQQIESVESSRFLSAFWGGVRVTLLLFFLVASYLLIRQAGRWLWQKFWAKRI